MYTITPKERLRQYAKHVYGEFKALELQCGLTNGTIANNSEPNVRVIQKVLENCPDLSPDWLILGQGPMLRTPENLKPISIDNLNKDNRDIEIPATDQIAEPTQPYKGRDKDEMITIPSSILQALKQQLENKDAQIATLLQIMNSQK